MAVAVPAAVAQVVGALAPGQPYAGPLPGPGQYPDVSHLTVWNLGAITELPPDQFLAWMQNHGLLMQRAPCPGCNVDMTLCVLQDREDGFVWRCRRRQCPGGGNMKLSIRDGSFFGDLGNRARERHLSLKQMVQLLFLWCGQIDRQDFIMNNVKIGSRETVVEQKLICREICAEHFRRHPIVLGGRGSIVEIDESVVSKAKYNVGHRLHRPQRWVLWNGRGTPGQLMDGGAPRLSEHGFYISYHCRTRPS